MREVAERRGHADCRTVGWRRREEEKPSEVCIKTVVSYSCCIRATRKPESYGPGPVNSWKPTPQTRCQATRSICVNWEYREKRDGALLIIESGNGSAGWLGVEALWSVYLSNPLSPTLHSFFLFLPSFCVLVGPCPPSGWRVWLLGFWRMRHGRCVLAGAGFSLLLLMVVESGLQKSNNSEKLESFVCAIAWGLGLLWPCWNTEALAERRQSVSPQDGQIKK